MAWFELCICSSVHLCRLTKTVSCPPCENVALCCTLNFVFSNSFFAVFDNLYLLFLQWRCWLGGRKGIRSVKNLSGAVLSWLSVWSKVQTCIWSSWCHCHSLSLALVKSRLILPFWYRLTRVVPGSKQVCLIVFLAVFDNLYLLFLQWVFLELFYMYVASVLLCNLYWISLCIFV